MAPRTFPVRGAMPCPRPSGDRPAFVFTALVTQWPAGLDWTTSFLVGAVPAPTDPVFTTAIVGRKEVPAKPRKLLNAESGAGDGPALPVVLVLTVRRGRRQGSINSLVTGHTSRVGADWVLSGPARGGDIR